MKWLMQAVVLIVFLAVLMGIAVAQSPREQLQQMVEQLRTSPNDNALREKIIKLATSIKPAPAIPEEAREPFVMGATVLKKASDLAAASKAVDFFTQALTIAPWFAEAYYNRAIAREFAGQFEPAIDDLKLYLEFKLTDTERREAQDKIYSLKAEAQVASAKKSEDGQIAATKAAADTPQAREAALLQKVEGARFVFRLSLASEFPGTGDEVFEIKNRTLHITLKIYSIEPSATRYGHGRPGEYLVDRISYRDGAFTHLIHNGFTIVYRIRADGQALIREYEGGGKSEIPRN